MAARIATGAKSVSAVVMDPWTGEIYAEASYPSYDANDYAAIATEDTSRFHDPNVSEVYEPGSVFKMLTVVAGWSRGHLPVHGTATAATAARQRQVADQRRRRQGDGRHEARGRDRVLAERRRREGGARAGPDHAPRPRRILHEVWTRFGFGQPTGIDVSGEVRGPRERPGDHAWREIDLANGSFGQGVAVTQVQLAAAYAAMVNGGILVKPHVVAGLGADAVEAGTRPSVLQPGLSPVSRASWTTCWRARGTPTSPGPRLLGGRQDGHRRRSGTPSTTSGAPNTFNFSCVGFIGRQRGPSGPHRRGAHRGHPSDRNARGQLVLSINSTELFRRVATDAVTTPGPPAGPAPWTSPPRRRTGDRAARCRCGRCRASAGRLCHTSSRDRRGAAAAARRRPALRCRRSRPHRGRPPPPHRRTAAAREPAPDPRRRGRIRASSRRAAVRRAARGADRRPRFPRRGGRRRRRRAGRLAARPAAACSTPWAT